MSRFLWFTVYNVFSGTLNPTHFTSLVPRRKVWLTPAAGVLCSNADNVGELKTWTKVNFAPGKIPSGARAPENV